MAKKGKKTVTEETTSANKAKITRTMTKERKLSALDAAAKILEEKKEPMTCPEMIEVMAAKGYWKSPGGTTPASTLYAAILRAMKVKEKEARSRRPNGACLAGHRDGLGLSRPRGRKTRPFVVAAPPDRTPSEVYRGIVMKLTRGATVQFRAAAS